MRKPSRKTLVRNLDKIVGDIVKARDGKCIVCGTTQNLTSGHLFSRVAYATRWDLTNCWAQCLSCNLKHEHNAYPMIKAVQAKGVDTDELNRRWHTVSKLKDFQLAEILENLRIQYKELLTNLTN